MAVTYLDSSAIVKLAVNEPETMALRRYLRRRSPVISSALARTEVLRAVAPAGARAVDSGRRALTRLELVRINNEILDDAATMHPLEVRTLDAIHLATAARLGEDLGVLVTYDERMATAAKDAGIRVAIPR